MENLGIADTPLVLGGNIPHEHTGTLREMGVRAVFPTGSRFEDIVATLKKVAK